LKNHINNADEMVWRSELKGYLIRVGIDTTQRNIGYCAPIFSDNRFEYIPLPQFGNPNQTTEELTYGSMKARNNEYGQFLSDFMHTDSHLFLDKDGTPYIFSVDENMQPLPAKDIVPHLDPEFVTKTFGDARTELGGRIPFDLHPEDYIFFYAGLSRYDSSFYHSDRTWGSLARFQVRNKCAFLIGYMKIKRIFDIKTEEDFSRNSSEIQNNAHFKERLVGSSIVKGEDESKLLDKAVQLNYWNPEIKKYSPTDIGKKIGLRDMSGMRIMKWLNETLCRELLEIVDKDLQT